MESTNKIVIHTDGGSRGNPGPAAIGVVINTTPPQDVALKKTYEYAKSINNTTNNVAEYKAVIFALKKTKQLIGKEKAKDTEVEIRSDSELLVSQLNGNFKIKDEDLKELFIEIWNQKQDFKDVKFTQIPREKNKKADEILNQVLNKQKLL